jgi:hypothetical protein
LHAPGSANGLTQALVETLRQATYEDALRLYREVDVCGLAAMPLQADLGRADRYYLLVSILGRTDVLHPWIYQRCREVEAAPDDHLDLWARGHYKSTVITFAGAIQEILRDPEITIGIFAHTRPIATAFLKQIKRELEANARLKLLYPAILWSQPSKEAPQWSEQGGIVVKRRGNPKEATIEAWGIVEGQPTSKHFGLRIYDDMVTLESVSTPEQIQKTTLAWELSQNLGTRDPRVWYIGTRYSWGDSYQIMMERGAAKPRLHPATDDGTMAGKPVFLSAQGWKKLCDETSDATIACQQLQNPTAGMQATFRVEWLRTYEVRPKTLNVYIMCDPASSRKKDSDNTAIAVIGVDAARNKYLLDGVRQKLNLQGRWTALYALRCRWMREIGVQSVYVGYERYGMQSDLEYFEERMEVERDHFVIRELAWPLEGSGSKSDRIQRLLPDIKGGRFYLPAKLPGESALQSRVRAQGQPYLIAKPIRRKDESGRLYDLGDELIEELRLEPFGTKRDLIDAASRIYDMDYAPPVIIEEGALDPEWTE